MKSSRALFGYTFREYVRREEIFKANAMTSSLNKPAKDCVDF